MFEKILLDGPFGLKSRPRRHLLDALLVVLIAIAIGFRFVALDHIPGINGDEAYLGTKVLLWAAGDSISLRTGTDLLPDPISLLLSRIILGTFGNSLWALRLPTALSGVVTVLVVYLLARNYLGRRLALTSAAITAALPTHLVYSRFFWEPSQSPLVCALWIWASLARRPILTGALGALAVVVHPTNAFLAPIVAWPHYRRFRFWYKSRHYWDRAPGSSWTLLRLLVLAASAVFALGVMLMVYRGHSRVDDAAKNMLGRLTDTKAMWDFVANYPGLMTGTTVYSYVVGVPERRIAQIHLAAFIACFVLPVLISLILDRRRVGGQCLALLATISAFFVFAGSDALSPNSERYALWMTIPHCLLAAMAWDHVTERLHWPNLGKAAVSVVCALLLTSFANHYFGRILARNSETELAFGTAVVEPKRQAFEQILRLSKPSKQIRIYTEDWWTYWAIKYLSMGHSPPIEVTILDSSWDRRFPTDFIMPGSPTDAAGAFYVGYPYGDFLRKVASEHKKLTRHEFRGYGGKLVLVLYGAPAQD